MGKLHSKNGFEFKYEKNYGSWYGYWYFRPNGEEIFINYQCGNVKTVTKDIELFLSSPSAANEYYFSNLKRLSDVPAAKIALDLAEERYSKVNSPDFDLRGNNPNREERAKKEAHQRLASAKSQLQTAKQYTIIINKQN